MKPYSIRALLASDTQQGHTMPDGSQCWVPARHVRIGFLLRLRDAWSVLRGRAEAVQWPEQEGEARR